MRERCSPAVLRLLEAAAFRSQLADAQLPETSVFGSTLLAVLLEEEDGRAALLAEQLRLDASVLCNALLEMPKTRVLLRDELIIAAAGLIRKRDADESITSDILFLATLHCDAQLRDILEGLDFSLDEADRTVFGAPAPALPLDEPLHLPTPSEQAQAGRVLDVNANRARESLRVLDDHARFVMEDPFLTGEVKRFRHELAELISRFPSSLLVTSRDTQGDVGTVISVAGEMSRSSAKEIAIINWKRLQESLRSLEEYGKLLDEPLANGLEQLRYRAYTLEKAFALGIDARGRLADACLYLLLTGASCKASLEWTIAEAAAGGAAIVQLREKELDDRRLLQRARDVRRWTRKAGVLFIVNDRPDIASLADADGVHLGQDDTPVYEARTILGSDAIIGVSTHNLDQVRQAILDGATYIGIGPTFASSTKNFEELAGLEFVTAAMKLTSLPAFALGGINADTIDAAIAAGARRVAVSAAIAQADNPRQMAHLLCKALR